MRSSIGRNQQRRSRLPESSSPESPGSGPTRTRRGTLFGTFTRAKCSVPVCGSRTATARLSDWFEM